MFDFFGKEFITVFMTALVSGLGSYLSGIRFIHEGELGVKLRFGKAVKDRKGRPKVYRPGFVLAVPFVHTLRRRHVRQQTVPFDDQRIILKDNFAFRVGAVLMFRVTDVYKALFEIDDLDGSIEDLGMGLLRDVLMSLVHTELKDTTLISNQLLSNMKKKTEEWGVEIIQFNLTNCAPTPETELLMIASAGALMKAEALEAVARKFSYKLANFPPALAAVLVGAPFMPTVSNETVINRRVLVQSEEKAE